MIAKVPILCDPRAFDLLARNRKDTTLEGLMNCAIAIAMHKRPSLVVESIQERIKGLANIVTMRVRGRQPQAQLAHLHDVMFDGPSSFAGNKTDYRNPANFFLPTVLECGVGSPAILSLVYVLVTKELGFKSWGVAMPGHFLAGIELGGKEMIVDPFCRGKVITRDECRARTKEVFGDDCEIKDDNFKPASNEWWIMRILQVLCRVYEGKKCSPLEVETQYTRAYKNLPDAAAMLEMQVCMFPNVSKFWRDLGLLLYNVGRPGEAASWLVAYLQQNPNDEKASELRSIISSSRK